MLSLMGALCSEGEHPRVVATQDPSASITGRGSAQPILLHSGLIR
jgi:hypothetical protein